MKYSFTNYDLFETYKYLHTIPEPEFEEYKTSQYIFDFLSNLGLKPVKCAKTGVYADICGNEDNGRMLLIRADIDALPVNEESGVPYSSSHDGYMHACGHDMHTSCLLYAAKALSENTNIFSGTVRVLFQPAEEGSGGALPMIREGAADGVTAAIAMHADPLEKVGTLVYRNGSITASPDDYKIIIKGIGGHGALPEKCINPITVAGEIISKYSTLKNDYFKNDECVTTVCTCHGGTMNNIIPDIVEITGTARAFDSKTRYALKDKLKEICIEVCKKYNAGYDFTYNELFPPTVNDPDINKVVISAATEIDGITDLKELSEGSMTGDDFSYFAERCPASYYRVGTSEEGECIPLHSSKFKIDESVLMIACELFVNTALKYLNQSL